MLSPRASAEPGRWRTARTPYLAEIMAALSPSHPAQRIVFMKGAQVGGTEAGNNWLGFLIHHAPGPALAVQPTVELAKRFSRQRVATLIEETPALRERVTPARSRDSGNTVLAKEFPGGILVMTGANSAVGLRSPPARYLFLDEVDAYPASADEEGDPVALAEARTLTFAHRRKIFLVSIPTIQGLSRIEREYLASDQRRFFVPCPRPDRFDKAVSSGTDIVAVDLEDSVAPRDKAEARQNALAWFSAARTGHTARALRINSTRTAHGLRDILAILEAQAKPDLIILPKVEAAADLEQLDALLQGPCAEIRFIALIESAKAFARLDEIARSSLRLVAFQLGSADLSADLRAASSWESMLYARSSLVRAAAAAGIDVIDTPFFDLSDAQELEEETRRVLRLGFTGKAAVHPKQIAVDQRRVLAHHGGNRARETVLAENEKGVGLVDGQMIDEAIARRARRVLALAQAVPARESGSA